MTYHFAVRPEEDLNAHVAVIGAVLARLGDDLHGLEVLDGWTVSPPPET